MKAALSLSVMLSIVTVCPARSQELNRAGSEMRSPDPARNGAPAAAAADAGFDNDTRSSQSSEFAVTRSLETFVGRDAAGVQGAPAKPSDLIPPLKRLKCSKLKGALIGAGIGAGVGLVGGALSGSPDEIGGRVYPALVYGAVGAGLGAVVGLAHCR